MSAKGTKEQVEFVEQRMVKLDEIRVEQFCHIRDFDDLTAEEYRKLIEADGEMDSIELFEDEKGLFLIGGTNRIEAHRRAGRDLIEARIYRGTPTQALILAVESNSRHGLKMSSAQKRLAVRLFLENKEIRRWSDRRIARSCGVSPQIVADVRSGKARERKEPASPAVQDAAAPVSETLSEPVATPRPVSVHEREEKPSAVTQLEDRCNQIREWIRNDFMDWQTLVEIINSECPKVRAFCVPNREFNVVLSANGKTTQIPVSGLEYANGELVLEASFAEEDVALV